MTIIRAIFFSRGLNRKTLIDHAINLFLLDYGAVILAENDPGEHNLDNPETWKFTGNEFFKKGDFESAIKCYGHAIEIDPYFIDAWNNMGLSLLKLGRIEEAKECNEKVKKMKDEKKNQVSSESVLIPQSTPNYQTNEKQIENLEEIRKKYEDGKITYNQYQAHLNGEDTLPTSFNEVEIIEKKSVSPPVSGIQIQEYRRTCHQCGTVWHSLVSREKQLEKESTCGLCMMCGNVGQSDAFAQWNRNKDATDSEIVRLKKCPKCGSVDYGEEILTYTK